jgi:hypothetical protein
MSGLRGGQALRAPLPIVVCTSTIRVTRCLRINKCSVLFFKTHYGDTVDLQHIRLLPEDRMTVARKLASGVTVSRCVYSTDII